MIYTLRRYHENEKRNEEKCLASFIGAEFTMNFMPSIYRERATTAVDKALEGETQEGAEGYLPDLRHYRLLMRQWNLLQLWLCAALLIIFMADQIYSSKNPNTGEGITSYAWYLPGKEQRRGEMNI